MKPTMQNLRDNLVPFNPDYPVIKIKYDHNAGYMEATHVYAALDALEKKARLVLMGLDEFTALEQLAYWVLVDSANVG